MLLNHNMIHLKEPKHIGSYKKDDVIFLLKDISKEIIEQSTEIRERKIQSGIHYSEMLPIEYKPGKEYYDLFYNSLDKASIKIARAVAVISELILEKKGNNIVLVSLARAGTPAGILIKRYIKSKFGLNLFHYSVSIIRGKGFDENAIIYLINKHEDKKIQFIDGWTGKGAIFNVLKESCDKVNKKYKVDIDSSLAVIADPGHCTDLYGTREDFLIPSACLNSTVSGLISRTVHNEKIIKKDDFHGVKVYYELKSQDVSNFFVDKIEKEFDNVGSNKKNIEKIITNSKLQKKYFIGMEEVRKIQEFYSIEDVNFIKPGIGETTRVLLRRIPWKILVNNRCSLGDESLKHIMILAKEKNVGVERFPLTSYKCCGIIKPLRRDKM